jgi:hypothetical protein
VNSENLNPNVEKTDLGSLHIYAVLRLFIWFLAESLDFIRIILLIVSNCCFRLVYDCILSYESCGTNHSLVLSTCTDRINTLCPIVVTCLYDSEVRSDQV